QDERPGADVGQRHLALDEAVVLGVEERERAAFDERAFETATADPLDPPRAALPRVPDLHHVEEVVLLRRPPRRHLDAPGARDDAAGVARQDALEVAAPERLPHMKKIGILGQRPALEGDERPVAPAAPGSALVVARRPELLARPAARHDRAARGEEAVDA